MGYKLLMGYIRDMIDKINIFKTCLDNTETGQPNKKEQPKKQSIEDEEFEKELYDLIEGMKEPSKQSIADELGLDFIMKTRKKLKAINKIHERNRKFSFGEQETSMSKIDFKKVIQKEIETTLIDQETKTSVNQDSIDQNKVADDIPQINNIKSPYSGFAVEQTESMKMQEEDDILEHN